MFAVEVENRVKETIKRIPMKYVEPGYIVLTDCWRAYDGECKELDLNHSKFYKDS